MTPASDPLVPPLDTISQRLRGFGGGCRIPAGALVDPLVAQWVRSHGVTITVQDDHELDLARYHRIRPVQVVFRCGSTAAPIRRAAELGVPRFIVTTAHHIIRLADYVHGSTYVYLDDDSPLVLADRRLKVIGLHSDVDDFGDPQQWAVTAERLLQRVAQLSSFGSTVRRISLSGGSVGDWAQDGGPQLTSIMDAVDRTVRDVCSLSRVAKPAVTLSAVTAGLSTRVGRTSAAV